MLVTYSEVTSLEPPTLSSYPSPAFFLLCAFSGHLSGLPYMFIGFLCVSLGENRDLAASLAWHRAWHMLGAQEIMLKK